MKYIKVFVGFVSPFFKIQILLLLFIIINTVISLAPPYALKIIIDECIPNKDLERLYTIGSVLLLIYLARAGINHVSAHFSTIVYNKIGDNIRLRLFHNMMLQPFGYFESNTQGDIIQKINFEVGRIQSFLANGMIGLINNVFLVAGISLMLAVTDKVLFLVYLSLFPIPFVINVFFNNKIKTLIKQSTILEGRLFNFYIDKIKNIALIKSYNSFFIENNRLRGILDSILNNNKLRSIQGSLASNLSNIFISLGPLLILLIGGYQAILGTLTIGSVVAFIQYSNRLTPHLNGILGIHLEYSRVLVSIKHIYPLLEVPDNKHRQVNSSSFAINNLEEIRVDKLAFSRNEKPILQDLCFTFRRGETYAIVGENGSGKSTLLKILCGFYTPTAGSITINGNYNLADVEYRSWSDNLSVVFQEPLILNDTIMSNVIYGTAEPVIGKIWEALDIVGMSKFVEDLPAGIFTTCGDGEHELKMSGGQRQLLALARALYRDRSMLLLDEATSAVDTKNEEQILRRIKEKYKDRIVIFVSHRLSTIKNLDRIGVVAKGIILEQGNHSELIAFNSHYKSIFNSQFI